MHTREHTELDLDVALLDLGMDGEWVGGVTLWTEARELTVGVGALPATANFHPLRTHQSVVAWLWFPAQHHPGLSTNDSLRSSPRPSPYHRR